MSRSPARMVRATVTATLAGLLAATVLTPLASAAPAPPKPGTACAMSGLTSTVAGVVYVCRMTSGTPLWSPGLTTSRSPLTVRDGWVKAAEDGMTSAFGTVTNTTSRTVRIVGAASPLSAVVQMHEVVMADAGMVMQERPAGYVIPPGGMLELKPGGNHLMLMKLRRPVTPGMLIPITLITSTGGLIKGSFLAKNFAGGVEDYNPGMS